MLPPLQYSDFEFPAKWYEEVARASLSSSSRLLRLTRWPPEAAQAPSRAAQLSGEWLWGAIQ